MEKDFGERLKYALRIRGIRQKELARLTNLTEATVSRYINNQRTPDIIFIKQLVELLGVSADFLLGFSDEIIIRPDSEEVRKASAAGRKKTVKYKIIRIKDGSELNITDAKQAKVFDNYFLCNKDFLREV